MTQVISQKRNSEFCFVEMRPCCETGLTFKMHNVLEQYLSVPKSGLY